jgi:hypothetical protein
MILRIYFSTFVCVAFAAIILESVAGQLVESERLVEYYKRNYTWPLTTFVPNTLGWNTLMSNRLAQIEEIESEEDRYRGFVQTLHSALLAPNYTEYGFGLARCPDELIAALRKGVHDGIETASEEEKTEEIVSPKRPWFIQRQDLVNRVLHELQPYAEQWSGMKLNPWGAYGFRLYRNESTLFMHIDRMQTHIISFILHIDSSDDAEPWPIFIEDFNGNTHEVILTPGDMLFYESSKCFHGRPRKLNGSWYSSIFVHYTPHEWANVDHELEADYAVPPVWSGEPQHHHDGITPKLAMAGAGMKEPDCPNEWCNVQNAKKWSGPGEKGVWITPNFERRPLPVSAEVVTEGVNIL